MNLGSWKWNAGVIGIQIAMIGYFSLKESLRLSSHELEDMNRNHLYRKNPNQKFVMFEQNIDNKSIERHWNGIKITLPHRNRTVKINPIWTSSSAEEFIKRIFTKFFLFLSFILYIFKIILNSLCELKFYISAPHP